MPGGAAVAIWCDVSPDVSEEFDDWHAHEHMPERLAIPGFQRGSRWVSMDGNNGYFMLYEAEALETIASGPYLQRLNDPTPWSRKMMPHHRNMTRSLCRVQSSHGSGLARALLTLRFSPVPGAQERLEFWLSAELLPTLPQRKGLVAAQLLQAAAASAPAQTTEQKIRGGDASADWILLVNGYSTDALGALSAGELGPSALAERGAASGAIARVYGLAFSMTATDRARRP